MFGRQKLSMLILTEESKAAGKGRDTYGTSMDPTSGCEPHQPPAVHAPLAKAATFAVRSFSLNTWIRPSPEDPSAPPCRGHAHRTQL